METIVKRTQLTPWEKLQSDKLSAKRRSEEAAQRINDNFAYMQDNIGKLMLSGISSYLSPIGTTLMPHLWGMVRPALLTWGIGKMQSLLLGILFGKKKKK
ncbi:MAG: hypothetical protein LBL58_05410 [Tannerellaceae bacterium]|nr:hypothetical protein [Tannerellaceae bacterium]